MNRTDQKNYNPPKIGGYISIAELASRLGVTPSYIRKLVSVTKFIQEDEYININGLYFKEEVLEKLKKMKKKT